MYSKYRNGVHMVDGQQVVVVHQASHRMQVGARRRPAAAAGDTSSKT